MRRKYLGKCKIVMFNGIISKPVAIIKISRRIMAISFKRSKEYITIAPEYAYSIILELVILRRLI